MQVPDTIKTTEERCDLCLAAFCTERKEKPDYSRILNITSEKVRQGMKEENQPASGINT